MWHLILQMRILQKAPRTSFQAIYHRNDLMGVVLIEEVLYLHITAGKANVTSHQQIRGFVLGLHQPHSQVQRLHESTILVNFSLAGMGTFCGSEDDASEEVCV